MYYCEVRTVIKYEIPYRKETFEKWGRKCTVLYSLMEDRYIVIFGPSKT